MTLDADVVAGIRRVEAERGVSFEQALNDTIRAGLSALTVPPSEPYRVDSFSAEIRPGVDLRAVNRLLADVEDEELVRKTDLGT